MGFSIEGNISSNLLIDLIDLELSLNFHFVLGCLEFVLDKSNKFISILSIEASWESLMLSLVAEQAIQDEVAFLRSTHLFPVAQLHFLLSWQKRIVSFWVVLVSLLKFVVFSSWWVWILKTLLKASRLNLNWHLNLLSDSSAFIVVGELSCVTNCEAER